MKHLASKLNVYKIKVLHYLYKFAVAFLLSNQFNINFINRTKQGFKTIILHH